MEGQTDDDEHAGPSSVRFSALVPCGANRTLRGGQAIRKDVSLQRTAPFPPGTAGGPLVGGDRAGRGQPGPTGRGFALRRL